MKSLYKKSLFERMIDFILSPFKWIWNQIKAFFKIKEDLKSPQQTVRSKAKELPIRATINNASKPASSMIPGASELDMNAPLSLSPKLLELIEKQRDTYQNVFLKHPTDCHQPTHHYDWWIFPVEAPNNVSETSKYYSVNNQDVENLLHHQPFISTYIETLKSYLDNLKHYGWNRYEVRYAKMLSSLNKFITVSKLLSEDNNALILLAKEAISFAKENIASNNPFLQKELKNLIQTIQPKELKFNI